MGRKQASSAEGTSGLSDFEQQQSRTFRHGAICVDQSNRKPHVRARNSTNIPLIRTAAKQHWNIGAAGIMMPMAQTMTMIKQQILPRCLKRAALPGAGL